jgi:predicted  nucleic acid-binding Zn-ribbon protein
VCESQSVTILTIGLSFRLQSENIVLEETVTKLKAEVADWERKWSSLNERFNEILLQINRNEFTYDQFERYRQSETFLKKQIDSMAEKHCSLEQENLGLRKSADKWNNKYMHLR